MTEMNITPLLDLAFVLLVIFILTTTPLTQDMDLNLPKAAQRAKEPTPKVTYVTVDAQGNIFLNRKPVDLAALQADVLALRTEQPDLNFVIRGDARSPYKRVREALETLQLCNVAKVKLSTEADNSNRR